MAGSRTLRNGGVVKRWWVLALLLLLAGCREVRVQTLSGGVTTADLGNGNQLVVVRDQTGLARLGVKAPVRFKGEFVVVLLMGPHQRTGYRQVIESIRANDSRVRVVAFEQAPADGGEPTADYRTYTLWIIPNSVYKSGIHVEAVTPSDDPIAQTVLP
jgi:hypothetical protein